MQSVREGIIGPQSMCIGRVNGGANAPPVVDLPPQTRQVTMREEKTASASAFSLVFIAKSLFYTNLNTLPLPRRACRTQHSLHAQYALGRCRLACTEDKIETRTLTTTGKA